MINDARDFGMVVVVATPTDLKLKRHARPLVPLVLR